MKIMKLAFLLILLVVAVNVIAMSPEEATNLVSKTNNYLLNGEQVAILSPQVMILYKGTEYWVVAGMSGNNANVYIPVNNSIGEVANGAIEIRDLIGTNIVLNRLNELKGNYSVGDWPFSYPNKTRFYDLERAFSDKSPSLVTIQSDLDQVSGASSLVSQAEDVESAMISLSEDSKELAEKINEGIEFEKVYFTKPDTNQTRSYEKIFEEYFELIETYKINYNELNSSLTSLKNNIAAFQSGEVSSEQKNFYIGLLAMPQETAPLNNVFSISDQTKTLVEEVFSSSKNIENLVLNLETRKERNEAWKILYAPDAEINKLNSSFSSLSDAAEAILAEDNIGFWKDQDTVSALKTNWKQATTKYGNGVYISAKSFGADAKKNVKKILEEGTIEEEEGVPQELIINAIIILIVVIVGLFLFEKFYLNKKKENEMKEGYEDEY